MIKGLICLSLVVFLTACSSAPTRWYLNGRSQNQLNIADAQCQAFAANSYQAEGAYYVGAGLGSDDTSTAGLGALLTLLEVGNVSAKYENCMRQQGFAPVR
jgi:hypothetical protein